MTTIVTRVTQRCFATLAPDEGSPSLRSELRDHIEHSLNEAATVQCVGMAEPIPLMNLYQPTRIKQGATSVSDLLSVQKNAIIFAGPGQGKTTLLRHILLTEAEHGVAVPIFFTLRTVEQTELLSSFVGILDLRRRMRNVPPRAEPIRLLVDGYDEINDEAQKRISEELRHFELARVGTFILTCRSGYTVYKINSGQYELAEFDSNDAVRYVDAFADAMQIKSTLSGTHLVKELEQRKLTYIVTHPLMLTLACVVKSRTSPLLPPNSIELLRQAMETLAFRWDESKLVTERKSTTGLLSLHMMQCMTRIAYEMQGLRVPVRDVLTIIDKYLNLLHRTELMPEKVLDDIRRFFGVLSTTPDGYCQFSHNTIHDYLAARYEVENGLFQPGRVTKWDMRAAYAASLQHDATFSLHNAFVNSSSIEAVRECLSNSARFDVETVANSVFTHFDLYRSYSFTPSPGRSAVTVSCQSDFFDLADKTFLDALLNKAPTKHGSYGARVVFAFCLYEYWKRGLHHTTLSKPFMEKTFGPPETILSVIRAGSADEFPLSYFY